jgi:hypothetical protein
VPPMDFVAILCILVDHLSEGGRIVRSLIIQPLAATGAQLQN